jgi:hypothetical protein
MNADVQSNAVQQTGRVLSWLVSLAIIGTLFFFLGLARSDSSHAGGFFPRSFAPVLTVLILASEAAAFVILLVGIVRWPLQIIRSPRWLLSALGVLLAAGAILMILLMAITAAIALP